MYSIHVHVYRTTVYMYMYMYMYMYLMCMCTTEGSTCSYSTVYNNVQIPPAYTYSVQRRERKTYKIIKFSLRLNNYTRQILIGHPQRVVICIVGTCTYITGQDGLTLCSSM